jgi:hypothetical protein
MTRVIFFLLINFSSLTFGWNAIGHKLVAKIAYEHLHSDVRNKVDMLVSYLNQEYPDIENFIQIATWPDQLREQKIELFTHWHYIDNSFSTDGTPIKNLNDTDNASWAINQMNPILKNTRSNPYEKARFLAFLVHIVGDLHQPLHTVSRISAPLPDGDAGGNLFVLGTSQCLDLVNRPDNLHHIWDNGLGYFTHATENDIDRLAKDISDLYPQSFFGGLVEDLDQKNWEKEGMALATSFIYNTPENECPSKLYISKGQEIAKQRVALSGYRLAGLLNTLFASNK